MVASGEHSGNSRKTNHRHSAEQSALVVTGGWLEPLEIGTPQTKVLWHLKCTGRGIWPFVNFKNFSSPVAGLSVGEAGQRSQTMLSSCANPQCGKPFLRLGQGKLFLVETEGATTAPELPTRSRSGRPHSRPLERYWLCDTCAKVWTLAYDRIQGIALVGLRRQPLTERVADVGSYRESA